MPVFYNPPPPNPAKSEVALLKQYLSKDHRYRHKLITFPQRSIVTGLFPPPSDNANQIPYQQATRNCSAMFSFVPGSNLEGDVFADKKSCLWGIQGGDGGPSSISSGLHTSTDLTNPAKEPPVGFYLLEGSWFGDWNLNTNNFLRAVLGTANYGLASMWAHAGRWRLETLAVGDTLGDGLLRTANDTNSFPNGGGRSLAIMGDPTLRLHATAPVSNVIVVNTSPLTVAWSPSPETNVLYIVYRSINGLDGPFTRLTSTPISATSYVDAAPPSGAKTYQVRALNQVISGSGSYTNLSQGVFTTTN
jgi:hypothetical protein